MSLRSRRCHVETTTKPSSEVPWGSALLFCNPSLGLAVGCRLPPAWRNKLWTSVALLSSLLVQQNLNKREIDLSFCKGTEAVPQRGGHTAALWVVAWLLSAFSLAVQESTHVVCKSQIIKKWAIWFQLLIFSPPTLTHGVCMCSELHATEEGYLLKMEFGRMKQMRYCWPSRLRLLISVLSSSWNAANLTQHGSFVRQRGGTVKGVYGSAVIHSQFTSTQQTTLNYSNLFGVGFLPGDWCIGVTEVVSILWIGERKKEKMLVVNCNTLCTWPCQLLKGLNLIFLASSEEG